MDGSLELETILCLKYAFSDLTPEFNFNHAVVFLKLLEKPGVSMSELNFETGLDNIVITKIINDLMQNNLLSRKIAMPVKYYLNDPEKAMNELMQRKTISLEKKKQIIEHILQKQNEQAKEMRLEKIFARP